MRKRGVLGLDYLTWWIIGIIGTVILITGMYILRKTGAGGLREAIKILTGG